MKKVYGNYFYGNKISDYGLEKGYVDYSTLAKAFDAVMSNDIISKTADIGFWELVNGSDYDEEDDEYAEIYQCFIIDEQGAEILSTWTDEIVYYNEVLDMYVWGVTHCETPWCNVLTDIRIDKEAHNDENTGRLI